MDTALKEMDMILDGCRVLNNTDFKFIARLYTETLARYARDEIKRRYPDYKEVDEAIPQVLSNGCRYDSRHYAAPEIFRKEAFKK